MRYARIYPWRRTRRFRAPSNGPEAFFVAQFSAGYTTNMFGFDLRQGHPLVAGAVVALMYSGGNVLEDIAVARAVHDLHSLVDRAPREAHRRVGDRIEEVPISDVVIGDQLLVRAGGGVSGGGVGNAA